MAWSDNVRCLYCDGKLPLYRKITSGQFCSAVHRKAYWQDQERLAVERLHQTHDSLHAYRCPEALEAILGKPAASEPVSVDKYYLAGEPAELAAEQAPDMESQRNIEKSARSASNIGNVTFPGFITQEKPALRAWNALLAAWDTEFAQWPMSASSLPSSSSEQEEPTLPTANGMAVPLFHVVGLAAAIRAAAEKPAPIEYAAQPLAQVPLTIAPETQELSRAFLESLQAAEIAAQQALPDEAPMLFADRMAALAKIPTQSVSLVPRGSSEPQPMVSKSQNISCEISFASPAVAALTRMEPLPLTNAPRALSALASAVGDTRIGDLQGYAQPMELNSATGAPFLKLALVAAGPALQLASGSGTSVLNSNRLTPLKSRAASASSGQALALRSEPSGHSVEVSSQSLASRSLMLSPRSAPGCRYDVQSRASSVQQAGSLGIGDLIPIPMVPVRAQQPTIPSLESGLGLGGPCGYPFHSAPGKTSPVGLFEPLAAVTGLRIVNLPEGVNATKPAMAKIRPLAFSAKPLAPSKPQPVSEGVALIYAANVPINPTAKWEPVVGTATAQRQGFRAAFGGAHDGKHAWTHAVDFWQHAPRDLKLLAIAIPILLGLALRPSLPKVRVAAPASTEGISKNLGDGIHAQFVNVRNSVAERAAVRLSEDFRTGLDEWQTRGDLSTGWAFDENGFVKPGTLALYRPSVGLRDYDMEFLGLIDKKALSWVVRAKDFDNYYVVKLVVTKAGPLPAMGITRYAVINGKAQASVSTVAAINARPDMLYHVTLNVHEDTFLLSLQDTVVDNWTEPRLKTGGVGFFAARGEESRVRWLQITHQYDMLGRLCAYLAPYNIPTTEGSW